MTVRGRIALSSAALLLAALAGAGCASNRNVADTPVLAEGDNDGGGIWPFGGGDRKDAPAQIGVNGFLWQAALETLNFMPLASADPFGGVIITDWFSDPQTPNERFKATVYILDTRLRADALKVALFKQVRTNAGWSDAPASPDAALQLENAILTQARQLKLSTLPN